MNTRFEQRTLARTVSCSGIGLHSGKAATLTLAPAPVNHGIKFIRTDLPDRPCIPANFNRVVDTSLATVIGYSGCIVSTIEHLMASFAGLGIDNAVVELDAYEMPIMDGSAGPFTALIRSAGIDVQPGPRCFFVVKAPIVLENSGKSVAIYPSDTFRITYTIDYAHPLIGRQTYSIEVDDQSFEKEICRARTFGFLHEYEYMKHFGLALGGSLENALVIDEEEVLNPEGLRYPDEFVRHKILDCIGDFSMIGLPILGHIVATKSGHAFNHQFLKTFFEQKTCWDTRTIQSNGCLPENRPKSLAISCGVR
ncbi:MAG: UDP-3-O-acyl-N-acetylglucosamine deacetylase [Desulfobacterales bacterium]|nr:UDP-3-O-acyl-N-acetylglucosamine deacetylase [Desulfobacterales bacterium]